jgi:hypothetical protein
MSNMKRLALVLLACSTPPLHAQPVGGVFRVNTYTTSHQSFPSVAMCGQGRFVVAWESVNQDGSSYGVFAQRFDGAGAPAGAEFRVNTYTTSGQDYLRVACDTEGGFVVVWRSYSQGFPNTSLFGQRYDASGNPLGTEFRASTYTLGDNQAPAVAVDFTGNFVVAWEGKAEEGSGFDIFFRRYGRSGAPLGAVFRANTTTTGDQRRPAVGLASVGGAFVIAWEADGKVFAQRYIGTGAPAGAEFQVNTYGSFADKLRPQVSVDAVGGFVVVWEGFHLFEAEGVIGQRFSSSGDRLGSQFRINTYTTGVQHTVRVASDSEGGFVTVWTNFPDFGAGSTFSQRYASSGAPIGAALRVNASVGQSEPAVALGDAGNVVVVWHERQQPSADDNIFGQRFQHTFPRGDANADGFVSVLDVFQLINFLFAAGPLPP